MLTPEPSLAHSQCWRKPPRPPGHVPSPPVSLSPVMPHTPVLCPKETSPAMSYHFGQGSSGVTENSLRVAQPAREAHWPDKRSAGPQEHLDPRPSARSGLACSFPCLCLSWCSSFVASEQLFPRDWNQAIGSTRLPSSQLCPPGKDAAPLH